MPRDPRKWLEDVRTSAAFILAQTSELCEADYCGNLLVKSAVERHFEIIGEALNGLRKDAPDTAAKLSDVRKIVAFRNILIHAYFGIDDELVWGVTQNELPVLAREVTALLAELPDIPTP